MSANIGTNTLTVSGVSLTFLPAVHRVRKARLAFTAPATADTYEITVEFSDDVFEEYTLTGVRKDEEAG